MFVTYDERKNESVANKKKRRQYFYIFNNNILPLYFGNPKENIKKKIEDFASR